MASLPMKDCTTPLEDAKLLFANDYMRFVSSGVSGLGTVVTNPAYGPNAWPPGPRPDPYKWTDPKTSTTWTLVLLDGKWLYQSSKDQRYFISASNLYDLQGVHKDPDSGLALGPVRGTPHPDQEWHLSKWTIGGLGAGWVILGGLGLYSLLQKGGKK